MQREIADAQEKGINEYYDSLLLPTGERAKGDSDEMKSMVAAAVKEKKTQLHTNFDRMLAVAAPSNGDGFIQEVMIPFLLYAELNNLLIFLRHS